MQQGMPAIFRGDALSCLAHKTDPDLQLTLIHHLYKGLDMKNIHILVLPIAALLCVNLAQAQTTAPAEGAAPAATTSVDTRAALTDPLVQKRQADSEAKAEYKAKKKTAKANMKVEKAEAKSDLKEEKQESTKARDKAMAADPMPK
ncbi:hypothetical protein V8G57_15195 [Collimonas sp. H4R21]|uniref:Uncharacterized protein n=1 Tax=Collimonas rhizosphaerae TaxID=3126357 RepID=A0ABU9PXI9_9BURK